LGAGEQARAWLHRLRHVELEVTGADLLDAGISAGPALGAGLRAALRAKLDGATAGREDELEVALKAARASG
jgi:tRNA nucleotidyltransferase (CCA-adding enzyme)